MQLFLAVPIPFPYFSDLKRSDESLWLATFLRREGDKTWIVRANNGRVPRQEYANLPPDTVSAGIRQDEIQDRERRLTAK